jgi:hypothetical protein
LAVKPAAPPSFTNAVSLGIIALTRNSAQASLLTAAAKAGALTGVDRVAAEIS